MAFISCRAVPCAGSVLSNDRALCTPARFDAYGGFCVEPDARPIAGSCSFHHWQNVGPAEQPSGFAGILTIHGTLQVKHLVAAGCCIGFIFSRVNALSVIVAWVMFFPLATVSQALRTIDTDIVGP